MFRNYVQVKDKYIDDWFELGHKKKWVGKKEIKETQEFLFFCFGVLFSLFVCLIVFNLRK